MQSRQQTNVGFGFIIYEVHIVSIITVNCLYKIWRTSSTAFCQLLVNHYLSMAVFLFKVVHLRRLILFKTYTAHQLQDNSICIVSIIKKHKQVTCAIIKIVFHFPCRRDWSVICWTLPCICQNYYKIVSISSYHFKNLYSKKKITMYLFIHWYFLNILITHTPHVYIHMDESAHT